MDDEPPRMTGVGPGHLWTVPQDQREVKINERLAELQREEDIEQKRRDAELERCMTARAVR
jgi:hypothetical protein